jgi:ABC-type amino acid transport substrate-binding protein
MAYPEELGVDQGPGRFAFDYLRAAEMVVDDSGLSVNWVALPIQRMFHRLKQDDPNFCIGGAGLLPERRDLGKFTSPFIDDRMVGVVALNSRRGALDRARTLSELMAHSHGTFLAYANLNYGEQVTPALERLENQGRLSRTPHTTVQILEMLASNRADYALVSYTYVANYLAARQDGGNFAIRTFPDMHRDFHMAFLCSRNVPDTVITKLDQAVQRQAAAIQARFPDQAK